METETLESAPTTVGRLNFALTPVCVTAGQYDETVSGFDGVAQEATVNFAAARWPGLKLEPWIYHAQGKAVAAALVMLQQLPARLSTLAIVKWGPVIADETAGEAASTYRAAITHLMHEYAVKRHMMLTILQRAEAEPVAGTASTLSALGFATGNGLEFPKRYLVRLQLSDAELRASFSQKWRYHLSRSERQDLSFSEANLSQLPLFNQLYQDMAGRKNFPDYSAYQTLQAVASSPVAALRPRLFFVMHNGVAQAGAVIFTAGRTAAYLYGATQREALPIRAGYFMHARIIEWLRDNTSCDWYDLGGSDGFSGLHQFKKGMVGTRGLISVTPPVANFAASPWAKFTGTAAYAVRDRTLDVKRWIKKFTSSAGSADLDPD